MIRTKTPRVGLAVLCVLAAVSAGAQDQSRRGLEVEDYFRLQYVSEPRLSPDEELIAYTVTTYDLEEDESSGRVWTVPTAGGDPTALTSAEQSSGYARWSPDGKYLAFLSARDDEKTQVWLLPRRGGEARKITDLALGVGATVWLDGAATDAGGFEWSPDSRKIHLVLKDPRPGESLTASENKDKEDKTPEPWVITRRQFKVDYEGYLDARRTHIYLLDVDTEELTQITSGDADDIQPAWSPDGDRIAFVSNRSRIPDSDYNTDVWVVAADNADKGALATRVSQNPGPDQTPTWSPNGKSIAFVSQIDAAAMFYATSHLSIAGADGQDHQFLTQSLDRNVSSPKFSRDGKSIYFSLEDEGEQNLAKMRINGGRIERLISGTDTLSSYDIGPNGTIAASISRPQQPSEIFLLTDAGLEQRTHINADLLGKLSMGAMEKIRFPSLDGTPIEAFVIKPLGFEEGQKYPTILSLHGGPQSQYDFGFKFEEQLYAANGYVVVLPNPRGSTGYGQAFCYALWRDWGGVDFDDVMAAVDATIERGWTDPDRLGVTGWSYGGMLTNHVITKTDRFNAAATGASATLYVVNYGHDQYQRWWEYELGLPWEPESRALWEELSPFNRVQNVVTPTLIIGGEKDWNVPIINSEQLFQALVRLGVETELVIYPGEHHSILTPSYIQDLYERYLQWFGKYLVTKVE